MKKFWNWKNQQTDENQSAERVLEFYGTIAEESWFDDDITPAMFKEELFSGSGPVIVWINSPGGDCIAASQIYAMLMDYPFDVTVKIDGLAASAASVIAMAGDKVVMPSNTSQSGDNGGWRPQRNAESNRYALRSQGKHYQRL